MNRNSPIVAAGIVLGLFAVAGVGLVAITHAMTDTRITENRRQAMLNKLQQIVPPGSIGNDPLEDRIELRDEDMLGVPLTEAYRVRDAEGGPVALIVRPVVPDGYAGPIRLLVSVLTDGSLGGVRVLEHHETPGLGDQIEERKSNWIIDQFTGKSLGDPPPERWAVKRDGGDFDQFTGATITPRSIVAAVRDTLRFVAREGSEQLFAQPAIGALALAETPAEPVAEPAPPSVAPTSPPAPDAGQASDGEPDASDEPSATAEREAA